MQQSFTLIRLPSPLKRSLQRIAAERGTSFDQLCASILTDYARGTDSEFSLEDSHSPDAAGAIIRLTNHILSQAMDAAAPQVTIENEDNEFAVYAQDASGKRELCRWPLHCLSGVRMRLQSMAHGTCEIHVQHNGQPGLVRLLSLEPSIIRLVVE